MAARAGNPFRGVLLVLGAILVALVAAANLVAQQWYGALLVVLWVTAVVAILHATWGRPTESPAAARPALDRVWVGAAVLVSLVVRLLPLRRYAVPPGYDYGFYKVAFHAWQDAAPAVPLTSQSLWISVFFEPGLLALHQALYVVTGLDAATHLRWLIPVAGALLALPLFVATRAWFDAAAARVSVALYAVAFAPLLTHLFLYGKNILALHLLLVLLWAARRAKPWLSSLLLVGLAVWHRPTFLAGLAVVGVVVVQAIARRTWRAWVAPLAVVVAVAGLLAWLFPLTYIAVASSGLRSAVGGGAAAVQNAGTFIAFLDYQKASAAFLAAAAGGWVLVTRRRDWPVAVVAGLLLVDVAFHFLFYKRFIVMFDLFALVLAGAFLARAAPRRPAWRAVALAAVVVAAALPTWGLVQRDPAPPFQNVTNQQIEGIRAAGALAAPDALLLARNEATPYVAAESGRSTAGPFLLAGLRDSSVWEALARSTDDNETLQILRTMGDDVYLVEFDAPRGDYVLRFKPYSEPAFTKVYDANGVRMWHANQPE